MLAIVLGFSAVMAAAATDTAGEEYLAAKAKQEDVHKTPSGLMYKVLREGSGASNPTRESSCLCEYVGMLIDGTEFDSSYRTGQPAEFMPSQVVKGWGEAMQLMVEGDKWELYIPSELGYGEVGSPPKIKGDYALVLQIELLKINGDTMPADRCDPNRENRGCDEQEVKYIEKIKTKIDGDTAQLKPLLKTIGAPGTKGKNALIKWMLTELGIKLKNGKLSAKWYNRIKRILQKLANPTVTLEGKPFDRKKRPKRPEL